MTKERVNLTLSPDFTEAWKVKARQSNTSLSQLIEDIMGLPDNRNNKSYREFRSSRPKLKWPDGLSDKDLKDEIMDERFG
jgi:hypothetical protein